MEIVRIIIGFLLGCCVGPLVIWSVFIYPYTDTSLKGFWWSLLVGVICGFLVVFGIAFWVSSLWPKD